MEDNHDISKALELFDQQKYQEAFSAFTDIYNHCKSVSQRQEIFQMLDEAYYQPNVEELKNNYEHNRTLLDEYPYMWGGDFPQYEDLEFRIFPVSDEIFYCYDPKKDCFSQEYDAKTNNQMRYFFENLHDPIQVKDEDNFYNLTFLNDNVRVSADFAGDNHIYLFYSSLDVLVRLMQTCDLQAILEQEKFVFLMGRKNWGKYPIDFKSDFGIDYSVMTPSPVRIEEIKRFCFWYKHAHSGTEFSLGVLGASDEIQMCSGYSFDTYSTVDGKPLYFSSDFQQVMSEVERCYTVEEILDIFGSNRYHIELDGLENYLDWLRQQRAFPHEYTIKEWFCGYFVFQYQKRGLNPRIAPMLLFDPHMWDPSVYSNLVLSFPYHNVLTCVREPIMTFARNYMVGIAGWNEFQTKYILGFDYCHTQFLHPELLDCYYGFRFEDLKTKPEQGCRTICRHLNLPYEAQMLQAETARKDRSGTGYVVKGFDTKPLHWDISCVLSEFDQFRLKMFYAPIQTYYGYPTFSFEEYPLSEEIVRKLFQYPFRFEAIIKKMYGDNAPSKEQLRAWIQESLQTMWRTDFVSPKLLSWEESKDG